MSASYFDTPNGERIYLHNVTEVTDMEKTVLHGRITYFFLVCVRTSEGTPNDDIAVEMSARLPVRYPRAKRLLTILHHNRVWFIFRNLFGRKKLSAARALRHAELYKNELRLQDEHRRKVASLEKELAVKVDKHRRRLLEALATYYDYTDGLSRIPEGLRDTLRPYLIRQAG